MLINNYFDYIYCLNLDRRPDRWKKMQNRFKKFGIMANRFSAVDRLRLRLPKSSPSKPSCLPTPKGCLTVALLSHLKIIRHAKLNTFKRILIFEDDVFLAKDFHNRFRNIQKINDWKIVYLGAIQKDWQNLEYGKNNFYLAKNTMGGFAYGLDCSLFDEILNLNEGVWWLERVNAYLQLKYYKQCFVFYPNIAVADVTESDLRNQKDQFLYSQEMGWDLANIDYD